MQNKAKERNGAVCEKIELANSAGVRLIYCQDCQVVELEIINCKISYQPKLDHK